MGKPCPGYEIILVDEKLEPSKDGEIAVKLPNPSAMIEYFKNPEATAKKIVGNLLLTGDYGKMSKDGYIKFLGRTDDIIKTAAYRVSALEVEEAISSHHAVSKCAVVGVDDPIRGTIIAAFVVLKEGFEPSDALKNSIMNHVKGKLAKYAYPRLIKFVDKLPFTITGKLRRKELKDALIEELKSNKVI